MKKLAAILILFAAGQIDGATTRVLDILYRADGTVAAGYVRVSWPAMQVGSLTIAPGNKRVSLANGVLDISLQPNDVASPAGTSYKADYVLSDGTERTEYWIVPTSGASVTLATVRVTTVPVPQMNVLLAQLDSGGAGGNGIQDMRFNVTNDTWQAYTLFDTLDPAALGTVGAGTQTIAARRDHVHPAADLGTSQVTGVLAAARFPALTGDVTTPGASLATTAASYIPKCQKYTVNETALTAAAGTEDETLFNLPARGKIVGASVKHSTAFAGTGITAVTVSVGDSSSTTFYTAAFDIFQAVADTTFQDTPLFKSSTYAARDVLARFTCTGGNCNAMTAGEVDFRICWVTLP